MGLLIQLINQWNTFILSLCITFRFYPMAVTLMGWYLPAWYLMDKVGVNLLTLIFVDTLILSAMDLTLDSDKENK